MNPEQDPQFEKVTSTLHGWSDEASPNLAPAILAQIRANRRRRTWLALAASLALLVGAGYWGGSTFERIINDMEGVGNALVILSLLALSALLIWRLASQKIGKEAETGK